MRVAQLHVERHLCRLGQQRRRDQDKADDQNGVVGMGGHASAEREHVERANLSVDQCDSQSVSSYPTMTAWVEEQDREHRRFGAGYLDLPIRVDPNVTLLDLPMVIVIFESVGSGFRPHGSDHPGRTRLR